MNMIIEQLKNQVGNSAGKILEIKAMLDAEQKIHDQLHSKLALAVELEKQGFELTRKTQEENPQEITATSTSTDKNQSEQTQVEQK